ncbi:hypothetical protein EDD17DRAFT_440609 [Pisolithus thermaeus]|nr:hypothetical protein EDD17DRAFT_440609 [Pisolithus thermaeus]
MLQRPGVGINVHRSVSRLQNGTSCRLTWVSRFSELASATKAANPARPKISPGSILTRSSSRPPGALPKRPVQRRPDNGRQRSDVTRTPSSAQLVRNANHGKDSELRQMPSQPIVQPAVAVEEKDGPAQVQGLDDGSGTRQSPQLASEGDYARKNVKAPLEGENGNLPRTNLAELFAPRIHSAQRTRGRGGDYSGYLPPAVTHSPGSLGPVERALLALGRNKDVPYESRRQALEIISQSVPRRARKA